MACGCTGDSCEMNADGKFIPIKKKKTSRLVTPDKV